MSSRKFNNFKDDLQITATTFRSANNIDLKLDTSKNLLIDASNIILDSNGDLSTNRINGNKYYIKHPNDNIYLHLDEYIAYLLESQPQQIDLTGGLEASLNNVDISGNLKLTNTSSQLIFYNDSTIGISNNVLVIDPAPASGDPSGTVIIKGNLEVHGTTTTINSSIVDISNKILNIASETTNISDASGAGIIIGDSSLDLSIKYNNSNDKFVFSKGIDVSGDINSNLLISNSITVGTTTLINGVLSNATIGSDLISSNEYIKLFTSKSTFAIENSSNVLQSDISNVSNQWITPPGYDISINLKSINSAVKIKFKVNYKTSTEAEQFISFRVTRDSNPHSNVVFQDCSLGSNMGVTLNNIYNGNFIDTNVPHTNPVTYYLHYKLDAPANKNIHIPYGIFGGVNYSNYISLQELYCP